MGILTLFFVYSIIVIIFVVLSFIVIALLFSSEKRNIGSRIYDARCKLVDYGTPLNVALSAANCHPSVDITDQNFPPNQKEQGKKDIIFKIFSIECNASSDEIIREMKKKGCRPATIRELLAYFEGIKYAGGDLVAIGSFYCPFGVRKVPIFCAIGDHNSDKKHSVLPEPISKTWSSIDRFLAVEEEEN